ncbi:zinc finger protein 782-like isoform X10 [Acipenser ruthenus]|uniref:zinc finger protein 782-like isoform X10 n=1 Tax=Acipenser ruthenus TaxID=7906 RepID=UPI00274087B3|nr:zinc finger protein 782-like isoform X10 [Acipenser ruthenus]
MDVSVSVSFFQDELASTIEHAVKAAVDTVLCQITKVVGGKFTEFRMEMAGKEKENESLKLRLEISESELKAVRECMNAADADIKQPLRNMNPDCNEQDFQRNENQGLFIRVQGTEERHSFIEAKEGPVMEAVYSEDNIFDQEWCGCLMEIKEMTSAEGVEVPELESVHIKEEAPELDCVHITEEVLKKNKVNSLENIVKIESSHCEDYPPEQICMKPNQPVSEDTGSSVGEEGTVLGSIQRKHHPPQERAADGKEEGAMPSTSSTASSKVDEGEHDSTPSPRCKNSSSVKPQCRKHRETTPQEEHLKTLRLLKSTETAHSVCVNNSETRGNLKTLSCSTEDGKSSWQLGCRKTYKRNCTGGTPFPCTYCGKFFRYLSKLKSHQLIHTGEKPYHCNACEKSFNQLQNLKTHQRIHTGEKPYHCNECEKSFNQLQNLKKHQQIHTGEKRYHCNECEKSFNQLQNLKSHHRIHTGEKPYHCNECEKSFNQLQNLKKHQRIHRGPLK